LAYQVGQQGFATCQDGGFIGSAFQQAIELGHELVKSGRICKL
jgi:hypothetical protein